MHSNDIRLVSKIYKLLMQLNIKKKKSNQKVDKRHTYTFLQRRHTDGQEAHEKMQIKTNQNGHHPTDLQTINNGEGVEKSEPFHTAGENVNCTTTVKNSMEIP